jgi:hypothetical protein
MKKCECGNNIDPRDLGEDATQCEWCENPEPPYYMIRTYGNATILTFLDMVGRGVELVHNDWLSVRAPSIPLAQAILDDWLAQQEEAVK